MIIAMKIINDKFCFVTKQIFLCLSHKDVCEDKN